ncbi:methyltransferase domain-containing protein [Williamsia serinedens]|uniref:methyltransferase domain-containing protein n=1 Tax=Williamsia serinedens TaxID=391736 RepID=UPI0020A5AB78|nr:class I SAM-dependent methyltransferase [Williamsia serinedens]
MDVESPSDLDAVRASYDAVADNYVQLVGDPGPWHRAALEAFAEQVRDVGPVLDAGCGPGRVAGLLRDHGVDVVGIDLSSSMIGHARPEELTAMTAAAGLDVVVEIRVDAESSSELPGAIVCARRPGA